MQRFQALSSLNQTLLHKRMPSTGVTHPENLCLDAETSYGTNIFPSGLDVNDKTGQASSFTSSVTENNLIYQVSTSETSTKDQVLYFILFGTFSNNLQRIYYALTHR